MLSFFSQPEGLERVAVRSSQKLADWDLGHNKAVCPDKSSHLSDLVGTVFSNYYSLVAHSAQPSFVCWYRRISLCTLCTVLVHLLQGMGLAAGGFAWRQHGGDSQISGSWADECWAGLHFAGCDPARTEPKFSKLRENLRKLRLPFRNNQSSRSSGLLPSSVRPGAAEHHEV